MLPVLYHAHHSLHQEDLPYWLNLAQQKGSPLLELGCGTGRLLLPLVEAGLDGIGLDKDYSMLEFTRSNIARHQGSIPMLVNADMSRFNLAMRFPLILLPCNTFSTLDANQRQACLECVHRHLANDGIFAVSLPNPLGLQSLPASSAVQLEDEFYHPLTGNPVQVSSTWQRTKEMFFLTWIYDQLLPDGTVERLPIETRHYLTSLETYRQEFERAGMIIVEIHGDYDLTPYDPESPYLIIRASIAPQ